MKNQIGITIVTLACLFILVMMLPLILLLSQDLHQLEDDYVNLNKNQDKANILNQKASLKRRMKTKKECPNIMEFPCQESANEFNKTICLNRVYHCNGQIDCPNGEDEKDCSDLSGMWEKILNTSDVTNEEVTHNNCTLEYLLGTECECDLTHKERIICKNQAFTQIPESLKTSIYVLNLDNSKIKSINATILNKYQNITTLSLKNNLLEDITDQSFQNLTKLKRLYLNNNHIKTLENNSLQHLDNLEAIDLDNNHLTKLNLGKCTSLKSILVSGNEIRLDEDKYPYCSHLIWVDFSRNKIDKLDYRFFNNCPKLETLYLSNNQIKSISGAVFSSNSKLIEIDLSNNRIDFLDPRTFQNLFSLGKLNLSNNPLTSLPKDIFSGLTNLKSLDLSNIYIANINPLHFTSLTSLKHVYFLKFRYCMYAPNVRICRPYSDGLSSLQHLLLYPILRIFVWIIAIITCFGNVIVFLWRSLENKEHKILSILVQNLAVADLFMGIYLVTIAVHDYAFRDQYVNHALKWMQSWQCHFCGFLATLSSELSILIVTLITIERYRAIRMKSRLIIFHSTKLVIVPIWIISLVIATFPLLYWSSEDDVRYYASNGVCFPLHIEDPFMSGWQFSFIVFLGVNFPAVMINIYLYTRLFICIRKDREVTRPALPRLARREDIVLAFRFFCIVLTDCLCWLPIIIIKIVAFADVPISSSIYAWLIVFILPINPALNPIIYTIAAPTGFRKILSKHFHRLILNLEKICGFHSIHINRSSKYSNASSELTRASNCSDYSVSNINFSEQLTKLIQDYELKEKARLENKCENSL